MRRVIVFLGDALLWALACLTVSRPPVLRNYLKPWRLFGTIQRLTGLE